MVPVLVGAAALMLQLTAWLFATVNISLEPLNDLILASQIAIPIAVLYVLLQARMARGAVADLVVEMGPTPTPARLRDALANALGDPSLQVAYWSAAEDRFVDAAGQPMELPDEGTGQAVTMLERNGVPEAAIIHDAILLDEPGLVASVASAMRLAVENDRLTAEVQAQLEEVRASRARIVEAGDRERRRVERDLHDGAQQRLDLAQSRVAGRAPRAGRRWGPGRPTRAWTGHQKRPWQRWPSCAIWHSGSIPSSSPRAASGRRSSPSPIARRSTCRSTSASERYSPAVEGAAYFVISEALANVTKYAKATKATVRIRGLDDHLSIEVDDDGIGGADPRSGSGLRGLADRLAALDGTITIVSPVGGGTRISAQIPTIQPMPAPV